MTKFENWENDLKKEKRKWLKKTKKKKRFRINEQVLKKIDDYHPIILFVPFDKWKKLGIRRDSNPGSLAD